MYGTFYYSLPEINATTVVSFICLVAVFMIWLRVKRLSQQDDFTKGMGRIGK